MSLSSFNIKSQIFVDLYFIIRHRHVESTLLKTIKYHTLPSAGIRQQAIEIETTYVL